MSVWDAVIDAILLLITLGVSKAVGTAFERMAEQVIKVPNGLGLGRPEQLGLADVVAKAKTENIYLMEKALRTYAADVKTIIEGPNVWGMRVEEVAALIEASADVSARHAMLIARDQTLKLNAAITQYRMRAAGIDRYEWLTSQDERVRPSHEALDGEVFSWDEGTPIGYHPGEDYQCRCVAIPVFDYPVDPGEGGGSQE